MSKTFTSPVQWLPTFLILLLLLVGQAHAQKPTSFSYPSPVVYSANVSNVYLSPTVTGSVDSYSMPASPALPAGLTFNTNTGIISGKPTAALNSTTYTITAHNGFGNAVTTVTMTVLNFYLDNANAQVSFGGTGVTISHPNGTSSGTSVGDITLYENVATLGGQAVDCYVLTKAINNVSSWITFDQTATSGGGYDSNDPKFFSPQLNFGTGGGNVTFEFQYIFHGTYNSTTKSGTNVVLQNVTLNTYDIDGNGGTDSYQFNEFGGFNTSQLGSTPTVAASYNAATGLTKFRSTSTTNSTTITAPATRVQVTYSYLSNFTIVVGAEGSGVSFFFLDMAYRSFAGTNITSSPSIDLDTSSPGVANESSNCGVDLAFTASSQTNIIAPNALSEFDVTYPLSSITNGSSEELVINGATAGTTNHALNFTSGSTGTVTVGGVVFNFTKTATTVGGITTNKIAFTRSTGGTTFAAAQAETLLDALRYRNSAISPTNGERKFTVNVLNTVFKSPDASFSAGVNCVSIAGHIYKDQNGLLGTDANTISANSNSGQFGAGEVYAILVNPVDNTVLSSQPVAAGGGYSFGKVSPGNYIIYVSNSSQNIGTTFSAPTYPSGGYLSIGENLGAGAGNDLLVDGTLYITVGSIPVTEANFGLNTPPIAENVTAASQPNPGASQRVVVPTLNGSDPEEGTLSGGTGNTLKITSLPTNGTLYYNGVEVTLNALISDYDPTKLTVDPIAGAPTIVFTYKEIDAGALESPNATVTMPFTEILISGDVYYDVNGVTNGAIDGTLINNPNGDQLYANLVDPNTGLVVGTVMVNNSGHYSFNSGSGLRTNSTFEVVISTVEGVVGTTTGVTSVLPDYWVSTADGFGDGSTDGRPNGVLTVSMVLTNMTTNLDFGIEQAPVSGSGSNSAVDPGGVANVTVPANTFTNGAWSTDIDGSVKNIRITSFPSNTTSITINGTTYNANVPSEVSALLSLIIPVDANGSPTVAIAVDPSGTGASSVDIPFVTIDNAGKESKSIGHAVMDFSALPVQLKSFDVNKEGAAIRLDWATTEEENSAFFEIQHSTDAKSWNILGEVQSQVNSKTEQHYQYIHETAQAGQNYYRLKMVDLDGSFSYSRIKSLLNEFGLKLTVFPNPASEIILLENLDQYDVKKIEIMDVAGHMVYHSSTVTKAGIRISNLASGKYIMLLTEANGNISSKSFVIRK
ncbi:putative secreted protein (Por secretion system target) [Dyadobacter jejuensis]|uniref:Putative secreted protein (Por secretion system target) n=1 Tax=Dyadobacter jejuensis TaxID=1082580 RepID=A0A316A7J1_9BACT|nr:putative Ig domain-containing protein [Dyadobacter jejuensis]PWJ53906.1 putative secreted protein (Por secretion system target) [Dyadobacter jejuensis]